MATVADLTVFCTRHDVKMLAIDQLADSYLKVEDTATRSVGRTDSDEIYLYGVALN